MLEIKGGWKISSHILTGGPCRKGKSSLLKLGLVNVPCRKAYFMRKTQPIQGFNSLVFGIFHENPVNVTI